MRLEYGAAENLAQGPDNRDRAVGGRLARRGARFPGGVVAAGGDSGKDAHLRSVWTSDRAWISRRTGPTRREPPSIPEAWVIEHQYNAGDLRRDAAGLPCPARALAGRLVDPHRPRLGPARIAPRSGRSPPATCSRFLGRGLTSSTPAPTPSSRAGLAVLGHTAPHRTQYVGCPVESHASSWASGAIAPRAPGSRRTTGPHVSVGAGGRADPDRGARSWSRPRVASCSPRRLDRLTRPRAGPLWWAGTTPTVAGPGGRLSR